MFRKVALMARWVILVGILSAATYSAATGAASASNGQPFPPGSRVEGSHSDALLILHNLGTGASLRLNSEGGGPGLRSESKSGDGVIATTGQKDRFAVLAYSTVGVGVKGQSDGNDGVVGWTGSKGTAGVWGNSTLGVGVRGDSVNNDGVRGSTGSKDKAGVWGWCTTAVGVKGESSSNDGVVGWTGGAGTAGVWGRSTQGVGVRGSSDKNNGVVGSTGTQGKSGVWGQATAGTGVTGSSSQGDGVAGKSTTGTGVYAQSDRGTALYVRGTSLFTKYATFQGGHGDLAENYYANGQLEGGDVVVIDPGGELTLALAARPNDTSVAGIVSTAPAMKLQGRIPDAEGVPLVIAGRTLCKVDASFGAIRPGDLLTSSPTPGHAMKARPVVIGGVELYLPGTIIGKALQALEEGRGVIMVLVTLQ